MPEPQGVTQRGFRVFGEFTDDEKRGTFLRVQESSAALRGPCVWLFQSPTADDTVEQSIHLDFRGAEQLLDALTVFILEAKNNRLTEPMENANGR